MAANRDDGICIRHWDFSETSQTVSIFTRRHGLIRGLAKGSKRVKGTFSGGVELLTRGEVLWIAKRDRDLVTLTQWDLAEVFPILSNSLAGHNAGLYAIDLLQHVLTDHDPHEKLYDALICFLRSMKSDADVPVALLCFQWALLNEAGYRPVLDRDAVTGEVFAPGTATVAFSARAGGTVQDTGERDRWRVRADTIALLRSLGGNGSLELEVPRSENAGVEGRRETVERANRLLAAYWRSILDRELTTMRRAFGELRV